VPGGCSSVYSKYFSSSLPLTEFDRVDADTDRILTCRGRQYSCTARNYRRPTSWFKRTIDRLILTLAIASPMDEPEVFDLDYAEAIVAAYDVWLDCKSGLG
jgi:hypothetical protein